MSAEGGLTGTLNEIAAFNRVPDTTQNILANLEDIGGPNSFPHIPVGWVLAGDTPFQWTKQVASHYVAQSKHGREIVRSIVKTRRSPLAGAFSTRTPSRTRSD
jgi:hypothetical protein